MWRLFLLFHKGLKISIKGEFIVFVPAFSFLHGFAVPSFLFYSIKPSVRAVTYGYRRMVKRLVCLSGKNLFNRSG
jgi:hypothetical protein